MAYKGPQEVVGPASATDETLPRFDSTAGDIVQGSGATVDDSDVMGGITQLNVDNLRLDGNTLSSTDTDGNIVLTADGTGTISVTLAPIVPTGDRADSLGSATLSWDNVYADAITFDDGTTLLDSYIESGTFTPVLEFGGDAVGITYATQDGIYYKIGHLVWIMIDIVLTSKGSSTGSARVQALPFTSDNAAGLVFRWSNISFSANQEIGFANVSNNNTRVALTQIGDNTGFPTLQDPRFSNNTELFMSGFYTSTT